MPAVKMKWSGDKVLNLIDRQVEAGLEATALKAQQLARRDAGVPNTGTRIKVKRARRGGNKTSRTEYTNSSRPGEPPRRRTGFGQKNIVSGIDKIRKFAFVGYTRLARYMMFHELGIHYRKVGFQRRATLVPMVKKNLPKLRQVFIRAARSVRR